jgi:hypothetical protein
MAVELFVFGAEEFEFKADVGPITLLADAAAAAVEPITMAVELFVLGAGMEFKLELLESAVNSNLSFPPLVDPCVMSGAVASPRVVALDPGESIGSVPDDPPIVMQLWPSSISLVIVCTCHCFRTFSWGFCMPITGLLLVNLA